MIMDKVCDSPEYLMGESSALFTEGQPEGPPKKPSLPPRDAWLLNPEKERIQTEVDDRGLVDIGRTIESVIATIDPSFEWPSDLNVHHFYWPKAWYPHNETIMKDSNPALFRNLPMYKGIVPVMFHSWMHIATEPPPFPNSDLRKHMLETWSVMRGLFNATRGIVVHERRIRREIYIQASSGELTEDLKDEDELVQDAMQDVYERFFPACFSHFERHDSLPKEFQFLDSSHTEREIAEALGKHMKTMVFERKIRERTTKKVA